MVNSTARDHPDGPVAELLARAVRSAQEAVLVTDAQRPGSPIVWANDAFTQITGYTLDEVRDRGPELLAGEGTDRRELDRLRSAMRAGRPETVTACAYRKDGSAFWCRHSVSPVRSADGTLTHWVMVQVDVSEDVATSTARAVEVETERRSRQALGVLSSVSDLLMDLDDPHTLDEVARLLRTVMPWAAFYLDDHGLRPAIGVDPSSPPAGRRRRTSSGPTTGATYDIVHGVLEGTNEGPADLHLHAGHPQESASGRLAALLRDEATGLPPSTSHVVVLPLPGRRRVLGVLVAVPPDGAPASDLDEHTESVLRMTARRVGLAVDNVRLYAREHRLAETLQRAMLPEQVEVDGLDVWTYYAPNSTHAQVGGDWYDVLQIAPDVVGAVVGDVAGHDVEAAAAMGQLRYVVRSYAYELTTPGPVLERVDQLIAGMRVPRSASLILTTLTRRETGWDVEYTRAGHLPALHAHRDGVTQLSGAGGPLVGFGFGSGPRATAQAHLAPGDVLVLYTDGLVERRDRDLREGLRVLAEVLAGAGAGDAAGIGEELLAQLADEPEDDVAVVVVRVPDEVGDAAGSGSGPRQRRWALPHEPTSIGRARHAVVRACRTWGVHDVAAAELVVSELVTNAVLHGWGHLALRLYDTDDGLRIEVEDANPAPPVATDGHPGRVGGYGMQIVSRLADWGWRSAPVGKVVWAKLRPGADAIVG